MLHERTPPNSVLSYLLSIPIYEACSQTFKKMRVINRSRVGALLTNSILVPLVITNVLHPLLHPPYTYKVPRREGEREEGKGGRE